MKKLLYCLIFIVSMICMAPVALAGGGGVFVSWSTVLLLWGWAIIPLAVLSVFGFIVMVLALSSPSGTEREGDFKLVMRWPIRIWILTGIWVIFWTAKGLFF